MHAQHTPADTHHHNAVDARGDRVMGFGHAATTHAFRLTRDGGTIEVTAKPAADAATVERIRTHLADVARAFREGDFRMPEAIHGRVPPGASVMRDRRREISYAYEKLERGARIRIATPDPAARAAVHDFLRFQIADHRTGDSVEVADH